VLYLFFHILLHLIIGTCLLRTRAVFGACGKNQDTEAAGLVLKFPEVAFSSLDQHSLLDVASEHGCEKVVRTISKMAAGSFPALTLRLLDTAWKKSLLLPLVEIGRAFNELNNNTNDHAITNDPDAAIGCLQGAASDGKLYSGTLDKKRGKNEWKSRYCAVGKNEIYYYATDHDNIPKGSVPLDGCVIRRYPDDKSTFEVVAPNIVNKKTFFGVEKVKAMLFRAKDEIEYHEWIYVLRAITGSIDLERSAAIQKLSLSPVTVGMLIGSGCVLGEVPPFEPQSVQDLNNLAVQYFLDVCKHTAEDITWSDVECPRRLPFISGYTFCRISFMVQEDPEINRCVDSCVRVCQLSFF
jgi:hypothetical protein